MALREIYLHIVGSDSPSEYVFPSTASKFMETINQPGENAAYIGWAFHDMKRLANWDVRSFDVRAANQWCQKHESVLQFTSRILA